MVASTAKGRSASRKGKRLLVLSLIGASLLVFATGSVVLFAYLFLVKASAGNPQSGLSAMPKIGTVPLLPNPPSVSPQKNAAPTPVAVPSSNGRINFLLLGLDQRDDEKGVPTRSDTIMVVSVDQANNRAAMISLPRDMWVQIPGYADNRINVANFLGDAYKYPGGGPVLAEKTIEQNFGLKIDYYARVDFRGLEKIVDTLGGVDIDVERAIRDDEYPTEDYGIMSIYIPAGPQHMNGKVALQYARSRHSENDFGRAQRQQRLLLAIKDRAMQLDVIPKLPSLIGTLFDMVQTDMPPQEFLRLAVLAKSIKADNVSNLVVDTKLCTPFVGEGGASLLRPNKPAIRRAIAALLVDPVVQEEAAGIEVANGTTRAGLATKTGDLLMDQGFDVVRVSTADRTDYKNTRIVVTGDKKGTAALLADALKVGPKAIVTRAVGAGGGGSDILVILGQDFSVIQ